MTPREKLALQVSGLESFQMFLYVVAAGTCLCLLWLIITLLIEVIQHFKTQRIRAALKRKWELERIKNGHES